MECCIACDTGASIPANGNDANFPLSFPSPPSPFPPLPFPSPALSLPSPPPIPRGLGAEPQWRGPGVSPGKN